MCPFIRIGLTACTWVAAAALAQGKEPLEIGSRRELFLDDLMVERMEGGAQRVFHRPVPREIVMTYDKPWESNCWYHTIFQDGDLYRMYYQAARYVIKDGSRQLTHFNDVYAESHDGIHWTRPNLGLVEFQGSRDNNIVREIPHEEHNLVVFRDENPDAAPDALYKAVAKRDRALSVWKSPDGVRWTPMQESCILVDDGDFDSQNVVFWDPNIKAYRAYYRMGSSVGRDIKTATSRDFGNWAKGTFVKHLKQPPAQFYTNAIRPYHRAPHIYIGMPNMYSDRGWTPVLEQLPDLALRRLHSSAMKRLGTALTDGLLMWSRDGLAFERAPSTFLPPGPERPGTWMYANQRTAWHLVETASTLEGADPELSIYATECARHDAMKLRRYTLRLDGFASIHAPIDGGEVITPPVIFNGSRLSLNFATSASGSVRVELRHVDGTPIAGFALTDSVDLYGDTADRAAMWKDDPDLTTLAGEPVRLRFVMRDADLYSFKFE